METIHVNTAKPYDVHIGPGLLDKLEELMPAAVLKKTEKGAKAVLITDENIEPLYAPKVEKKLKEMDFDVLKIVVPAGEEAKSGEWYLKILSFMAENHVSRNDCIFALGGGVVGDLSGFLAASFLRGIDFVQIPTTLLSAVDSSVGGKTAINLPEGKNLVGAFYQPKAVIMDTDTLDTLTPEVFADGCAEVIKYGMIWDEELFNVLKENILTQNRDNIQLMTEVIARCVAIKQEVVSQDELDKGLRNILNFGHTAAHSIEKNSDFKISHGSAVGTGMVIVSAAAERAGSCPEGLAEQVKKIVADYGLPVEAPFTDEQLYDGLFSDKKIEGSTINLILPEKIGHCYIHPMATSELKNFLFGSK